MRSSKKLPALAAAAALGLLTWAPMTPAAIYKFVDRYGVTHYTDRLPGQKYTQLRLRSSTSENRAKSFGSLPDRTWRFSVLRSGRGKSKSVPKHLAGTIHSAARRHSMDPALVKAVIRAESAFNPKAVSRAGAAGLMQLMPGTAAQYGVYDRFDPAANIDAGTRHLRGLLDMFNNDLMLALAAYNAGEGAVMKYGNTIPPYAETRTYVNRVLSYYRQYRTM
jgi:soluble lytic murein transglycosylase-like protein